MFAFALTLALAAVVSPPKPVFLRVDDTLEGAYLVAEAQVVQVETAEWLGRGTQGGGLITVRVTDDPRRIFLGHQHLGETLEVPPAAFGPASITGALAPRQGQTLLVRCLVPSPSLCVCETPSYTQRWV